MVQFTVSKTQSGAGTEGGGMKKVKTESETQSLRKDKRKRQRGIHRAER